MRKGHTASETVLRILSRDPVWAAYAIADLRPDLASQCRWLVSPEAGGLALLYHGLTPPILLTAGSQEGVAAALSHADLPSELFLSILPWHMPAVKRHYQHISAREMVRMVLPPGKHVPTPSRPARRLYPPDANRLIALYRHGGDYAPDAFDPDQLDDGFFFGIEDEDGTLASAGGTHVTYRHSIGPVHYPNPEVLGVSSSIDKIISQGVAAIGNIYTRPDRRGLGYAMAVTASITRALQMEGYRVIVLNVDENNLVAKSIYEKLGFDVHCGFFEGLAARNS